MNKPIISVVLGSYNRIKFLPLTVNSIREEFQNSRFNLCYEIIVIDGGSDDGSLEWLRAQKDIITIVQHNRGDWLGKKIERRSWGYFMNLGFKISQGKYVCMLSDDCLLVPGAIINGYSCFESALNNGKKVGAVAFYFRDWSCDKSYHVGCTLGEKMYVNHGMYLKRALEDVGYIDEQTFFFYNGDGDLCLKMWDKGYEVIDSPDSYVEHYPHANVNVRKTNYAKFKHDLKNYLKKWEDIFYDPQENNLGKIIEKFYADQAKTGEKFLRLHEDVIKRYPSVLKGKSVYKKLLDQVRWKYRGLKRRLLER